ncbi:MAG: sensor histidine kinase [Anaerolineae bacterium]
MDFARRDSGAAKLVDLNATLVQRLLRWRWPILALASILFLTWHALEHYSAGMLDRVHFLEEAVIFAVFGPVLSGLALTWLARVGAEQIKAHNRLHLEHELSRNLADTGSWDELTAEIVSFPRRVLPVIGTSLLVGGAGEGQLGRVAEWWDPDREWPPDPGDRVPCACQACVSPPSSLSPTLFQCHCIDRTKPAALRNRYCLPLKHGERLVGLLYHYLPHGFQPTAEQTDSLNALGAMMAVALDGARPDRPAQVEAAVIEAERKRIARDLHDTLGQSIGYLHLKLDQLTSDATLKEIVAIRRQLEHMSIVANESYEQVRSVVTGLHAPTANELAATLEERARSIGDQAGFEVTFLPKGTPHPLDPHAEQQVFYLVQEMLNNVAKHADAQRVELTLSWGADALSIACSDDGRGFDPSAFRSNGHLGLRMMHERTEEIGGELSITSSPGSGTKIALSVPTGRAAPGAGPNGGQDEDPAR